jgi:hypothetical protein
MFCASQDIEMGKKGTGKMSSPQARGFYCLCRRFDSPIFAFNDLWKIFVAKWGCTQPRNPKQVDK